MTSTGKAFISERGSSFPKLREWFGGAIPSNEPEFATDNPAMMFVYLLGALVGFFIGVFLSGNAGNTVFVLAAIGGAIAGPIGAYILVHFGSRVIKLDLAQPIGHAVVGLMVGTSVCDAVQRFIGWNQTIMIVLIIAGIVLGGMIRFRKQSAGRRKAEHSGQPEPTTTRVSNS